VKSLIPFQFNTEIDWDRGSGESGFALFPRVYTKNWAKPERSRPILRTSERCLLRGAPTATEQAQTSNSQTAQEERSRLRNGRGRVEVYDSVISTAATDWSGIDEQFKADALANGSTRGRKAQRNQYPLPYDWNGEIGRLKHCAT
jgi:hypothetical protein